MRFGNTKLYYEEIAIGNIGDTTMVKLTADMKETFSKMKVFPVATASKDGTPNVVPLAMVRIVDDE